MVAVMTVDGGGDDGGGGGGATGLSSERFLTSRTLA
jgi:hypothetical protein